MKRKLRIIMTLALAFFLVATVLLLYLWLSSYRPRPRETMAVRNAADSPHLQAGQSLKIMSWNIQFLAGKNYLFFFDILGDRGPDERPSSGDIARTLDEVVRVIWAENPDILLLQEADVEAKRTDYQDQLALISAKLPEFTSQTSCWYWKSGFVPHRRIKGAVGMKLAILSKYKISNALRYQLPQPPEGWLRRRFSLKRAILQANLPLPDGRELAILNTHLEAFAQGSDTMQRQVEMVESLLEGLTREGKPWVIGGDFNLLPPGQAHSLLPGGQQAYFQPETELRRLFDKFQAIPSQAEVNSADAARWFTHFPNDPAVKAPDRTIDYFFLSPHLEIGEHWVRQEDTMKISDHFPVILETKLP